MLLVRRILFVTALITLSSFGHIVSVATMASIQAIYFVIFIALRPFQTISNTVIEIINEVFFFAFVSSQLYLNSVERWDDTRSYIYIGAMIANSVIACLILTGMN